MPIINFTVHCVPVAQPRQRHAISKAGGYVTNYTPADHPVNAFKAHLQIECRKAFQGPPLTQPLRVFISAVFPRPEHKKGKKYPSGRFPKLSKPDCDNLAKSVCDALNEILWIDDAIIFDLRIVKHYCDQKESASVQILVTYE